MSQDSKAEHMEPISSSVVYAGFIVEACLSERVQQLCDGVSSLKIRQKGVECSYVEITTTIFENIAWLHMSYGMPSSDVRNVYVGCKGIPSPLPRAGLGTVVAGWDDDDRISTRCSILRVLCTFLDPVTAVRTANRSLMTQIIPRMEALGLMDHLYIDFNRWDESSNTKYSDPLGYAQKRYRAQMVSPIWLYDFAYVLRPQTTISLTQSRSHRQNHFTCIPFIIPPSIYVECNIVSYFLL